MSPLISDVSIAPSWLWVTFSIAIAILLAIDLFIFGKSNHEVSRKSALIESGLWISVALAFNAWFAFYFGQELGLEFLTGYLVEKSLSVDNLFVILLIFSSFQIPGKYQHRVLFYGVLGAVVFRAFFIFIGAHLLHRFHWIMYIFGAILIITAIKILRDTDEKIDTKESWSIKILKAFIPTTDKIHGNNFFIKENNIRKATPLFLALVAIEVTDIIFAVDSIPAVFAVTQDAFVAFGSNILAILGLRALFFVLADWVKTLRYLKPGLAAILGFIGTKMVLLDFFKIPSWVSLFVVSSILITAALSSWYVAKNEVQNRKIE